MDILTFADCSYQNKNLVGGKNSSLGELYRLSKQLHFNVSDGFAITTAMYDAFIRQNNLDAFIQDTLGTIDYQNVHDIDIKSDIIIQKVISGDFTASQEEEIKNHYIHLGKKYNCDSLSVAIRSSAIAEDLPNASFAGQQDTYLNVQSISSIIEFVKSCYGSLFNTRAISYRHTHRIPYSDVKISVAVQKMVRSDIGSAGVAFSIDPETGYNRAVVINSSYGLGELVVSGGVKPDEFICDKSCLSQNVDPILSKKRGDKTTKIVYKENDGTQEIATSKDEYFSYSITDETAICLAKSVVDLEGAYSELFEKAIGVDVEWAIDGDDHELYILQTRPETIHSNETHMEVQKYVLHNNSDSIAPKHPIIKGVAVGDKITTGKVKILRTLDEAHSHFCKGDILVTDMTTPDWEPIMKISAGIVTNKGGRTCHAAIVARELGVNAVVGTSNATNIISNGDDITLCCADGEEGHVYEGILDYHIDKLKVNDFQMPVDMMLNVGNPEVSFAASLLPHKGVGLARLEFIINHYIKIHPCALIDYPNVPDNLRTKIDDVLCGENCDGCGETFFVTQLARGIAKIASAFAPHPVVVRFSDFKSNEYKNLIGGDIFEPDEENPMIGWRGASRYYADDYTRAFELECRAIKYVREVMKLENVVVMIPFCRTVDECRRVLETMKLYGLERHIHDLKVYLMCEIPSNVIEADRFSEYVDGVSIGGNDLLQLTLGVDRDGERLTYLSNHTNVSYRRLIESAVATYKANGVKVGFCGQQPSDSVEFCRFLMDNNIDTISVTTDTLLSTINTIQGDLEERKEKQD